MSDFCVLDCIIKDSGGFSKDLGEEPYSQPDMPSTWGDGGFDVLSASMHDSGILTPNVLNDNDDAIMNVTEDDFNFGAFNFDEHNVLDQFDPQLLSPSSSSSDGSITTSEGGESTQNKTIENGDVLTTIIEDDLFAYLSNDDYPVDIDATLQPVDPRTISPASIEPEEDTNDSDTKIITSEPTDIKIENNESGTISMFDVDTDIKSKGQRKLIIKARRNIKAKVENVTNPAIGSEFPMNTTAKFIHEVKQSPQTIKLLSHAQQPKKAAPEGKSISIAKNPITVTPSINTGTTTFYLPFFNTKQQSQRAAPTIVVTGHTLDDQEEHGRNKRRRISASSSDSGLDDAASITSSGSGGSRDAHQCQNTSTTTPQHSNQRGPIFTTNNKYPRLDLNEEEKRLCEKENITLPSHYPLTKEEERNLKRIRRKIRNKVSAQDSRRRKKDYVESMESRAMRCVTENADLQKKVAMLEIQNRTLVGQLRRLHQIVVNRGGISSSNPIAQAAMGIVGNNRGTGNSGSQTSTALMVLMLSAALFLIPGMREQYESKPTLDIAQAVKGPPMPGQSRSLLHFTNTHNNIKEEFTPATNINVNNKNGANLQNIKVESVDTDASTNVADMAAMQAGMPHKASTKYSASSLGPFGDHDYYAFRDDDGGPSVKQEPWSPSMSPKQKSYIDADVPPLGYGEQKIMMEEQMQKASNIDFSLDDHLAHTNLSSENDTFSVEKEVTVTTLKEEYISLSNDYINNNRDDDMEMTDTNKVEFGGERRLNVSVSVGGGIGKGGGIRIVELHVPNDIQ